MFWVLWCKTKKTEADGPTNQLDATQSRLLVLLVPPAPSSPPFLRRMPFLPQPSKFILVWDRYQICWLAYLVAWFIPSVILVLLVTNSEFITPPPVGDWSIVISMSVCLSVHMHVSAATRRYYQIFCACCLWPWLNPPVLPVLVL